MGRRVFALTLIATLLAVIIFLSPKAFASTTSPVIYQLQTGTTGAATQEYISIYNNSDLPVEVTNWCVTYSSASDATHTTLGCLTPPDNHTKLLLSAHAAVTWASVEFVNAHPGFVPDIVFSAGMAAAGGHIRLIDGSEQEVDRLGYGTAIHPEGTAAAAHPSGQILERKSGGVNLLVDSNNNSVDFSLVLLTTLPASGLFEEDVPIDVCPNILDLQTTLPPGYLIDENGNCQLDVCVNLDGLQIAVPAGYESQDGENCTLIPLEGAVLIISELLADVAGADGGKEFIELYNPNNRPINISGYSLQLGPNFTDSYSFTGGVIESGAYVAFFDSQTGITLPNTASASMRLLTPGGNIVSETGAYSSLGEDVSWGLIDGIWQATYQATPNAANVLLVTKPCPVGEERSLETGACRALSGGLGGGELAPCREGQERNPDTNRCRTIQTLASSLVPCSLGQERNPDTNRCRSITSSVSSLVPCREDQERNPETNRCRSTASATSSLQPCSPGQERNPDTNRCRKASDASVAGLTSVKDVASGGPGANNPRLWLAGFAAVAAVGYGFYEWRQEIIGKLGKIIRWVPGVASK